MSHQQELNVSVPGGRWIALQSLLHMSEPTMSAPEAQAKAWSEAGYALSESVSQGLGRERSLAKELFLGVLRWERRFDGVIRRMAKKAKVNPTVREILRLGLYQLVFLDRIPPRAAVAETVALTRPAGVEFASGFVNGLLRRFQRERETLLPSSLSGLAGQAQNNSFPQWFVERMGPILGADLDAYLQQSNVSPELSLRVNDSQGEIRQSLLAQYQELGHVCRAGELSSSAICFEGSVGRPAELPGFKEGQVTVQDEAAQLITLLMQPKPTWTVLDACAAPGGKTAHLAMFVDAENLWAVEASGTRIVKLEQTLERLGHKDVHVFHGAFGDSDPEGWGTAPAHVKSLGLAELPQFDGILIDAPCTGWGIVHRHPEIKRHKGPKEVRRMVEIQGAILRDACTYLKPGGVLVYSVCSVLPEEGSENIAAFLESHPEFYIEDPRKMGQESQAWHSVVQEDGSLRTYVHQFGCDGFYAVRLRRRANTP